MHSSYDAIPSYHVRVVLEDGSKFTQEWPTKTPVGGALYANEDEAADNIEWYFGGGNGSCDCNKALFLHYERGGDYKSAPYTPCGKTMVIADLVLIRPDGSERKLAPRED